MNAKNSKLTFTKYQAGSYIFIENQPNSPKNQGAFFIIRSGKVRIENMVDQMLGRQPQVLGPGGFFGVISAMSAQESNETVIALTDCSLIVVKRDTFSDLAVDAPSIAIKIIRALSNDLRNYDDELAKRMVEGEGILDAVENLFRVGEFFFNAGDFEHAAKTFLNYIKNNPSAPRVIEAQNRLKEIELEINEPTGFNRHYHDDELICAEYMTGSELYIIQRGKVKITKIINNQEMILAILNAGEIVGEMSLLNNRERTANIIAYGETQIMAVDKDNFKKIIMQNKKLATKLITVLADRLWTIYKQLGNLLIEDPQTRLLDTLLTQLLKQHVPLDKRARFQFSFGRVELLNMCGISGADASEAFESLMSQRYMSTTDEGIYCSDLEELRKTVESAHRAEIRTRKMRSAKQD